jgi:hypothetical protein
MRKEVCYHATSCGRSLDSASTAGRDLVGLGYEATRHLNHSDW